MKTEGEENSEEISTDGGAKRKTWRRRLVWLAFGLLLTAVLCTPWNASVGSYGTLVAIPELETVVRAAEAATLIELRAQPGDVVTSGSLIGRMGNLELEEQIVQAQSDLARSNADYERLLGELRVREEAAARAELQLNRRRHEFDEINSEKEKINERLTAGAIRSVRLVSVTSSKTGSSGPSYSVSSYPAALAVLQADVEMLEVQLQEATARADRTRGLFNRGVLPRSETELAETRAASLSLERVGAHERLEAALVEHGRKYSGSSIEWGPVDATPEMMRQMKETRSKPREFAHSADPTCRLPPGSRPGDEGLVSGTDSAEFIPVRAAMSDCKLGGPPPRNCEEAFRTFRGQS